MRKDTLVIGIVIILIGIIFIPLSRISETRRVSTSQTQTVANSLCLPPIVTYLESGNYHIRITEDRIIVGQSALIIVYDQNNHVVFQSSILESWEPFEIKYDYDFIVQNSGFHNITLKDASGFIVQITTTKTVWNDVIAYPFESLFSIGLAMVIIGVAFMIFGSVIPSKRS